MVNRLSFTASPGVVTGFLGPNSSRKSTTMRIILGLDAPTSGATLVNGQSCATIDRPMHTVGALLDAGAMPGGRSASDHLEFLARSNGIGRRRVAEVLDEVGLSEVAGKRIEGFSLGMRQRLGIARALLGVPGLADQAPRRAVVDHGQVQFARLGGDADGAPGLVPQRV